ncbi:MAG TPA: baseplate J/gp47 family protein [Xanthobacteraceae bacterium]|nr:baseplate J/gp47 family protein [Xanthobacteraceae bacterium]
MPFARPSLTALRNQSIQDITTSGVPGLTGLLRNSVLRVLAWCMAGLAYSVYGYADWIARMGVPFTAEDEFLFAWAALIGIYPKEATAAHGHARFSGDPGRILPILTPLRRQDGTPYQTTAEGIVDGTGAVEVPIAATVLGAFTDADPETPITIGSSVPGINAGGLTVGYTVGGADQESNEALRTRMLAKYRAPPQGGAATDYLLWALEVPGVTRAWAAPMGLGAGTVIVYPMFDGAEAEHGGFPQGTDGVAAAERRSAPRAAGDQALVADHIFPLQPVTALVHAVAPTPFPVDVTLLALDPNTEEIRDAIVAALEDMFLTFGEVGGILYPSQFYEAILATPGIRHFTMSTPALPIEAPFGALPIIGVLTVLAPET